MLYLSDIKKRIIFMKSFVAAVLNGIVRQA